MPIDNINTSIIDNNANANISSSTLLYNFIDGNKNTITIKNINDISELKTLKQNELAYNPNNNRIYIGNGFNTINATNIEDLISFPSYGEINWLLYIKLSSAMGSVDVNLNHLKYKLSAEDKDIKEIKSDTDLIKRRLNKSKWKSRTKKTFRSPYTR